MQPARLVRVFNRARVAGDAAKFGSLAQCFLLVAQLVYKTVGKRLPAGIHTAVRQRLHLCARQLAPRRNQVHKAGKNFVDGCLPVHFFVSRHIAEHAAKIFALARRNCGRAHAVVIQKTLKADELADHAD